jgi:F-type H+-transporting ATPase subunit epsilon
MAAAQTMTLRILTPAGIVLEEEATSIVAPGEIGYLGILRNHAPLVTTLKPGDVTWQRPSGERVTRHIGAGLLEVSKNRVIILTDALKAALPADAQPARVS